MRTLPAEQPPREQAFLLDGRSLARTIKQELASRAEVLLRHHGLIPNLTILLVGDESDSILYAERLQRLCGEVGLASSLVRLEADTPQQAVEAEVERVSADPSINGLLIQLPLPSHISSFDVFCRLDPLKDVEGMHPENVGRLAAGQDRFVPTTPLAAMEVLRRYDVELEGKHVAIMGRSNVVGKPLAHLMLEHNATVTVLHSRSADVAEHTRRADIVAVAVGRPNLVTGDMLKLGAVVLDFGINFVDGSTVGDVHFEEAVAVASMVTPVPGGIGPLTNVMLASNLVMAAELQSGSGEARTASK